MKLSKKLNIFTSTFDYYGDNTLLLFKEVVDNFANLPLMENELNDARFVNDTNRLYVWSGTEWIDQGVVFKSINGQYFA